MAKITRRPIPVITGGNYEHVMCHASVVEENDEVTITMVAKGNNAKTLAAIMTGGEPMALSFMPIPVQSRGPSSRENN